MNGGSCPDLKIGKSRRHLLSPHLLKRFMENKEVSQTLEKDIVFSGLNPIEI